MDAKKTRKRVLLSKTQYERLSDFRYALRCFLGFSEEAAAAAGLTPHQHQALLAIRGFPGRERVTNGELAERLQIKHHSAVGLVNRLEAQGLVTREQGSDDKREFYISLSPRGLELLEQLTAVHREELQQVAPQLTGILKSLEEIK